MKFYGEDAVLKWFYFSGTVSKYFLISVYAHDVNKNTSSLGRKNN